jgi:type II secretory pathway pseudopilin PulG
MTNNQRPRLGAAGEAGFTLIEMLITTGLTLIIMGSTLAAMNNAIRASETATLMTNMNSGLRTAMDIMVRDMLQVGQGMPSGRTIDIPSGDGITDIKIPGPLMSPAVTRTMPLAYDSTQDAFVKPGEMTAVIPGPGLGPNGSDVITLVQADGAFLSTISDYDVNLTALKSGQMTVDPSVNIKDGGADDLREGDLIMLMKTSSTTLVQITKVDNPKTQTVYFEAADSLNLNQTGTTKCNNTVDPPTGSCGTLNTHILTAPGNPSSGNASDGEVPTPDTPKGCGSSPKPPCFVPSTATRIRLVSYYLDTVTDPLRPRLVRRVNNGDPKTYNNALGTVVAFDVEDMKITYDLVDGVTNPAGARMTSDDLAGVKTTAACYPNPCSPNQIRKINITLTGRSRTPLRQTRQYFRNTLTTQVSLRSMSFMDRYK